MAEGPWTCQNGHVNSMVTRVCRDCGAAYQAVPPAVVPSKRLADVAGDLQGLATIYTFAVVVAALAIAYVVANKSVCTLDVCQEQVDWQTFVLVAAVVFAIGMLLVSLLRGIGHILLGIARLVRDAEHQR